MKVALEHLELLPKILKEIEYIKKTLDDNTTKRWLSVKELAEYLSYSKDTIYKLKTTHFVEGIHYHTPTGKVLFDRIAIDEWVMSGETDSQKKEAKKIVDDILSSVIKK